MRAFGDYVNSTSGAYVYYRGRYNTNVNDGLFKWNNYGATNANNYIGSRILGQNGKVRPRASLPLGKKLSRKRHGLVGLFSKDREGLKSNITQAHNNEKNRLSLRQIM